MPFIVSAVSAVAGAIGGLVSGAGALLAGAGVLGRAIIGIGLNIGLNALANAFKKKPSTAASGAQVPLQSGDSVPRSCNFGKVATSGDLKYWNTYGGSNKSLQLAFVLGEGWNQSLEGVIIEGILGALTAASIVGHEVAAFTANNTADNIAAGLVDYGTSISVRFYDGRPGQLANQSFIDNANPAGRWTSDDKFTGMCWVAVEMDYDDSIFQGSVPSFTWIMKGLRLYDWRKDSTSGGTGAHRWDDTSTWEWSENAAVARYNYQRGIFINGQRVCGQGVAIYDLIHDLYTAAANVCDEAVALMVGSEKRYRISLIATDDVQFTDVLEEFDQSMAGFKVERQGAFAPLVGAAQTSIDTITDDDLVIDEPKTWTGKRSRKDLFNAVFGQFLDPSVNWQMNSYPPIIDLDLEGEDGERLVRDGADFPAVPSVTQALRIGTIRLNQIRKQATASITLGFNKVWWEAGDWITWNSAKYGNRKYMIMSRAITGNRRVTLDLAETATDVYSGAIVEPTSPSAPIAVPGTRISTVADFDVQATTITNDAGRVMPALTFTWTPPDDPSIVAVIIEYRRVGSITATRASDGTPEDGIYVTTDSVVGGADYEARATIQTVPARQTTFTSWMTVTTDAEVVVATVTTLSNELNALLDRVRNQIPSDFFTIRSDIDALSTAISTQVSRIQETMGRINIGLGKRYEQNAAGVEEALTVNVDTRSALAALFVNLFAITDAGEADVDVRFIAASSPDGVLASVALEVKATDGVTSAFVQSGIYIDAMSGPSGLFSRIRFDANSIVFQNPDASIVLDAFLLVVADEPLDAPIDSTGLVQADLTQRRLIHKTYLTRDAQVVFPLGAKPGFKWTHLFVQDPAGGHVVTVDPVVFIGGDPGVLTNARYSSECSGTILELNPPKATLTFVAGGNVAVGDSTSFAISPAFGGISVWDVAVDGPLVITDAGTYTITPLGSDLQITVALISGGGPGGGDLDGGGPAIAAGKDSTFLGMTAAGPLARADSSQGVTGGIATGGDTNINGNDGSHGQSTGFGDPSSAPGNGGHGGAGPDGAAGGAANGGGGSFPGAGGGGAGPFKFSSTQPAGAGGGGGGSKCVKTYGPGVITTPCVLVVGDYTLGATGGFGLTGGPGAAGQATIS